jgi:hypothetical protein
LDGLPYPITVRNQGALDAWQQLFKAHDWSQRVCDTWATPRATCLDYINELCWHVDQRLHPHPLSQRPSDWSDTAFATAVRWAANIHFERKRGALIETTPADALKRFAAVGPKKQAKLQRHVASLYDRITVDPADAPTLPPALGTAGIRAPLWRRGHFRSQPCGPARSSRKLIFVAPILIHAERSNGQVPPPKAYEITTDRARPSRTAGRQQQTKQRIQPQERA